MDERYKTQSIRGNVEVIQDAQSSKDKIRKRYKGPQICEKLSDMKEGRVWEKERGYDIVQFTSKLMEKFRETNFKKNFIMIRIVPIMK